MKYEVLKPIIKDNTLIKSGIVELDEDKTLEEMGYLKPVKGSAPEKSKPEGKSVKKSSSKSKPEGKSDEKK